MYRTVDLLVEDRNTAERAAGPLGLVLGELWVHRLQEGADEGHLEGRASNGALRSDVADYGLSEFVPFPRPVLGASLTLVICDSEGQQCEKDRHDAGVGHFLDHVVDLRGDVDIAKLGIGQHRSEGRRVGIHRGRFEYRDRVCVFGGEAGRARKKKNTRARKGSDDSSGAKRNKQISFTLVEVLEGKGGSSEYATRGR